GACEMATPLELILAARATASFPGAFPPLTLAEIDTLAQERGMAWPGRNDFFARIMPAHAGRGELGQVALIDGSVLVNAPFSQALGVLRERPAQREVDRRIVYIDPKPERSRLGAKARADRTISFLSVIVGSLSTIPREQPIRDNLETIEAQSRERAKLRAIVDALRPEVEEAVERLFGYTLFLDRPTSKRLTAWRNKAQQAAAEQSGFAFHAYAQIKAGGIVDDLARLILAAAPDCGDGRVEALTRRLWERLRAEGLDSFADVRGGATAPAIAFFRAHDLGFRIRRLRLLLRRLAHDWDDLTGIARDDREAAREAVFRALGLYIEREAATALDPGFATLAARAIEDPGAAMAAIAAARDLAAVDLEADTLLAEAMGAMPQPLRRRVLLAYLGFPFYDAATLPLLRGEGLNEFDPVKVDRISPEDAGSIRDGGTAATLRGTEFFSFGAFFSRAYRENDYLWGRLHGAERMIDLIASTLEKPLPDALLGHFRRDAFLAILDEERDRLHAEPGLVDGIRGEVEARFGTSA
ncbi:MAG: patatin-like protein, partial [Novosphingobium sp.]